MTPDLSNVDMFSRLEWASQNLEPVQPNYVVVFEDPATPDEPVKEMIAAPEWMACALNGGILPSIEDCHNMKLELTTEEGEKIETTYLEAHEIRTKKKIVHEKVLDYHDYLMSKPIGPMTEEEAIEYLIMKDMPDRVWHPKYKYNRQMFKIIKKDQLPKDNTYRNAWRLA